MSAAANADLNKINFPPSHFVSYLQSQHGVNPTPPPLRRPAEP